MITMSPDMIGCETQPMWLVCTPEDAGTITTPPDNATGISRLLGLNVGINTSVTPAGFTSMQWELRTSLMGLDLPATFSGSVPLGDAMPAAFNLGVLGLLPLTTYNLRVRFTGDAGTTAWSPFTKFTTVL